MNKEFLFMFKWKFPYKVNLLVSLKEYKKPKWLSLLNCVESLKTYFIYYHSHDALLSFFLFFFGKVFHSSPTLIDRDTLPKLQTLIKRNEYLKFYFLI